MTTLQSQIIGIKNLVYQIDLDDHHQGWKASYILDCLLNDLDELGYVISCPENMMVCNDCHEHVAMGKHICPVCGCDFTR